MKLVVICLIPPLEGKLASLASWLKQADDEPVLGESRLALQLNFSIKATGVKEDASMQRTTAERRGY